MTVYLPALPADPAEWEDRDVLNDAIRQACIVEGILPPEIAADIRFERTTPKYFGGFFEASVSAMWVLDWLESPAGMIAMVRLDELTECGVVLELR